MFGKFWNGVFFCLVFVFWLSVLLFGCCAFINIFCERLSQSFFLSWGLFCMWARPVGRARCSFFLYWLFGVYWVA